jgi:hypothetical protein
MAGGPSFAEMTGMGGGASGVGRNQLKMSDITEEEDFSCSYKDKD